MAERSSALMAIGLILLLAAFTAWDARKSANAADNAAAAKHDPCSFLTPEEIEAVMGPLAGPPFRAAGLAPKANGGDCRYEAADRRSIRVAVMWDGGAQYIGMMGAMQGMLKQANLKELKLLDGTVVAGEWDEARVSQCCEFNALRGDQLVTVDIAGSRATLKQASGLADAALKRLERPLTIDGNAGVGAAQERAARRPKPRSVCDLVTQADAEAIVGTALLGRPEGNNDSCRYSWSTRGGFNHEIKLMVDWQGGFGSMRTTNAMVGHASSVVGTDKLFGQTVQSGDKGAWDEFSSSIIGVAAVKSDVMVSVESGPLNQDIARAFVERAVLNLAK